MTIDRDSGVPLYRQIKAILLEEIRAGGDGGSALTESDLVQRFHVSRAPVRQALNELADEGYVYRERAKGTFPVHGLNVRRPQALEVGGLTRYLREQGLEPVSKVFDVRFEQPPEDAASFLGLRPDGEALHLRRIISVKREPLVSVESYVVAPSTFQPSAHELEEAGSVFVLLKRDAGIIMARAEHLAWATRASREDAKSLDIKPGSPVLMMESKLFARDGRPGCWRRAVHRADEFKYVFGVNR